MKTGNIQSLVAVAIALMALFISVWQGCEQRRHNRLTVKPILNFEAISHNNYKSIRLSNDGLGPALITKFLIIENGKKYNAKEGNPWTKTEAVSYIPYSEMYYYDEGATVKPTESLNLLTWKADSIRILNLKVIIEYESIYEESYKVSSDF